MVEVKFNNSNKNPFYGMRECLNLFQNLNTNITEAMLDRAWAEVENDKQKKELFFSLIFSIGDITARQHNIFKGVKMDNGGNANRDSFWTIFNWIKNRNWAQFVKFLHAGLFNEYQCFDTLFRSRVKTCSGRVVKVYDIFADQTYRNELANYVYSIVNGNNTFNKHLVAKFLTLPRPSKRTGHTKMLEETMTVMKNKAKFLTKLSDMVGWEYDGYNFIGYRKWRKEYNTNLESVLFSSGAINGFTQDQFFKWLEQLPSQARFRVRNKVSFSKKEDGTLKWPVLKEWYDKWENHKEEMQAEQRKLEEKIRQGGASEEDLKKLAKVKKEAKVNTGATNFKEIYESILNGKADALAVESFIQNKVNLPYNSLVIIDDSGSMSGAPFNFATFLATVCLMKNPDDEARNLVGFFANDSHWHAYIDSKKQPSPNSIIRTGNIKCEAEPLIDPTLSFMENYRRFDSFAHSVFRCGGTHIDSIARGLNEACKRNPQMLDALKNYPVWTIVSDSDFNNLWSPEASLNDLMRQCQEYFGFKPFIVGIAVDRYNTNPKYERFSGIENFLYIPSNPTLIEQFLTNFRDMDTFDVYAPLQGLYRTNRYELVRQNVI